MLERSYTIPVLFGICLGLIMAGVQVSAGALNAAVGQHQEIAPVAVENAGRGKVDLQAMGKRFSISLPLPGSPVEFAGTAAEKMGAYCGRCLEKAKTAGGEFAELVRPALDNAGERYRRWKDLILKNIPMGTFLQPQSQIQLGIFLSTEEYPSFSRCVPFPYPA